MKHMQDGVCECAACRDGLAAVAARERENLEQLGWYAHIVQDDEKFPFGVNYHTHGLEYTFQHQNFQFCLPVDPRSLHSVSTMLIGEIKKGKAFKSGQVVTGLLPGGNGTYPLTFKAVGVDGEVLLRVILPDPKGSVDPKTMESLWEQQWK